MYVTSLSRLHCSTASVWHQKSAPGKNGWTNPVGAFWADSCGAEEPCIKWRVHIGASWGIRLSDACAARRCGGLCQITLDSLVSIYSSLISFSYPRQGRQGGSRSEDHRSTDSRLGALQHGGDRARRSRDLRRHGDGHLHHRRHPRTTHRAR